MLVVEDNVVNQKVAVRMLERLGLRADLAANGRESIAMPELMSYDLVLMDCQMPGMDGFEATLEIRRREGTAGRRSTIVAMTAEAMSNGRCMASGMDDLLLKPVTFEAVAGTIRKWIPDRAAPRG